MLTSSNIGNIFNNLRKSVKVIQIKSWINYCYNIPSSMYFLPVFFDIHTNSQFMIYLFIY